MEYEHSLRCSASSRLHIGGTVVDASPYLFAQLTPYTIRSYSPPIGWVHGSLLQR